MDVGTVQVWRFWGWVACNWPTTVRRAAISPFFSSKLWMSSSVRPSKATLEQKPSLPRALATALGNPHSDKNAQKSNSLAMLALRCCSFAGAAQSTRFSPCLSLSPFSPPSRLNNRPLLALPFPTHHYTSPSPPFIPLPVLWTPWQLMPPSRTSLPPSLPLAMVTWCLNSSSLNSAASTNFPFLLYMTPHKGVQEKRTEVLENKVDRLWVSNAFSECFDSSGTWMKVSKALTVSVFRYLMNC